jgi:hypothetical protein
MTQRSRTNRPDRVCPPARRVTNRRRSVSSPLFRLFICGIVLCECLNINDALHFINAENASPRHNAETKRCRAVILQLPALRRILLRVGFQALKNFIERRSKPRIVAKLFDDEGNVTMQPKPIPLSVVLAWSIARPGHRGRRGSRPHRRTLRVRRPLDARGRRPTLRG